MAAPGESQHSHLVSFPEMLISLVWGTVWAWGFAKLSRCSEVPLKLLRTAANGKNVTNPVNIYFPDTVLSMFLH